MIDLVIALRGFSADPAEVALSICRKPSLVARSGARINDVSTAKYRKNALVYIFSAPLDVDFRDWIEESVESLGGWSHIKSIKDEFLVKFVEIDLLFRLGKHEINRGYTLAAEFIRGSADLGASISVSIDNTLS
ncbi:MAG: hypothetical protein ACT4OE_01460 [Sphingosinicella sp.]